MESTLRLFILEWTMQNMRCCCCMHRLCWSRMLNTGVDVMNKVYFPALFGACPCWCTSAHALCAILRSSGEGWLFLEHAWIMWSEMCEFRTLVWNSLGTLSSFQVLFTENDEILSAPSVHIRVVIFQTKTNNKKSTRKRRQRLIWHKWHLNAW